jgi:hypothetical protein
MSQHRNGEGQGRPTSSGGNWRQAFVSLLVFAVLAGGTVPGGIIELGRKGQKAKGSSTRIFVEGCEYQIVHTAGTLAEDILGQMITCMNSPVPACLQSTHAVCLSQDLQAEHCDTAACPIDPNTLNRNAVEILKLIAPSFPIEVDRLRLIEDDPNFDLGGVEFPVSNKHKTFRLNKISAIDPNDLTAEVRLRIILFSNDFSIPDVVVPTFGQTSTDVNKDLKDELVTRGFNVADAAFTLTVTATSPTQEFQKVQFSSTNSLVELSDIEMPVPIGGFGPGGPIPRRVPTLNEWALAALILMLMASAIGLIRRRSRSRVD